MLQSGKAYSLLECTLEVVEEGRSWNRQQQGGEQVLKFDNNDGIGLGKRSWHILYMYLYIFWLANCNLPTPIFALEYYPIFTQLCIQIIIAHCFVHRKGPYIEANHTLPHPEQWTVTSFPQNLVVTQTREKNEYLHLPDGRQLSKYGDNMLVSTACFHWPQVAKYRV